MYRYTAVLKQGEFGGPPERDNTEPSSDLREGVTTRVYPYTQASGSALHVAAYMMI